MVPSLTDDSMPLRVQHEDGAKGWCCIHRYFRNDVLAVGLGYVMLRRALNNQPEEGERGWLPVPLEEC